MYSSKIHPGADFPDISATLSTGETVSLNERREGCDWKMVVVYRGKHCPICTKYLNALESFSQKFIEEGVDLVAVSADSKAQLEEHAQSLSVSFPLAYGLTEKAMETLGVYVSQPRSEKETDHNFAEPALFVINAENQVQVVDIANAPFIRPDIEQLLHGLEFVRNPDNDYPVRGTVKQ